MKSTQKRQKAVAIAKDVLAQLRLRKYKAQSGTYVDSNLQRKLKNGDLQSQIMELARPCSVCALGSAFLSAARLFDKIEVVKPKTIEDDFGFKVSDKDEVIQRDTDIEPALSDYFTEKELNDIEAAFEKWEFDDYDGPELRLLMESIENDEDRLTWIMKEIIRQNGTFSASRANKEAIKIDRAAEKIRERANKMIEEAEEVRSDAYEAADKSYRTAAQKAYEIEEGATKAALEEYNNAR